MQLWRRFESWMKISWTLIKHYIMCIVTVWTENLSEKAICAWYDVTQIAVQQESYFHTKRRMIAPIHSLNTGWAHYHQTRTNSCHSFVNEYTRYYVMNHVCTFLTCVCLLSVNNCYLHRIIDSRTSLLMLTLVSIVLYVSGKFVMIKYCFHPLLYWGDEIFLCCSCTNYNVNVILET